MSKLDWSRAGRSNSDPARCDSGSKEFQAFGPTNASKKEFEAAKKARSESAKKAARTRKLNREVARAKAVEAQAAKEREAVFFTKMRENYSKLNNARRDKKVKNAELALTSFGKMFREFLEKSESVID